MEPILCITLNLSVSATTRLNGLVVRLSALSVGVEDSKLLLGNEVKTTKQNWSAGCQYNVTSWGIMWAMTYHGSEAALSRGHK